MAVSVILRMILPGGGVRHEQVDREEVLLGEEHHLRSVRTELGADVQVPTGGLTVDDRTRDGTGIFVISAIGL